jgi:hypothetical protein
LPVLMICFFYCVSFAKFLYFAVSGVLLVFALFMLKRGIYAHRPLLRKTAFGFMFLAAFKAFMIDVRLGGDYLCTYLPACSARWRMALEFSGMALFIASGFLIFHFWRVYMPEKERELMPPEAVHLRFWANLSMWGVIAMAAWLAAPWLGFLTVGYVPRMFTVVNWQFFAFLNLGLLLLGFWKSESCAWNFRVGDKDKMRHLQSTWTPRDTLWLNVFLYLIALALSYVSHDVLTMHGQAEMVQ